MASSVPILQFSYVVRDLDAAIEHWAEKLAVGPFFVLEHVPYTEFSFRGEPSPVDMTVAMAYSGSTQIELVCQHNDAPSIFMEFLEARGEGLQHIGRLSNDLASDLSVYAARGLTPVQEGKAENGTLFAYLDSAVVPGTMLELFQVPADIASAFDYMRKAAANWDPQKDPARR